jgi:hypothetical protein
VFNSTDLFSIFAIYNNILKMNTIEFYLLQFSENCHTRVNFSAIIFCTFAFYAMTALYNNRTVSRPSITEAISPEGRICINIAV